MVSKKGLSKLSIGPSVTDRYYYEARGRTYNTRTEVPKCPSEMNDIISSRL